jgi:hypothetical protein
MLGANKLLAMAKDTNFFVLLLWANCFFNLLVAPLFYNIGGHFRSIYPPTNLEFQPLEVMRSSFLAFKPSSTYTLIGPWCKSMLKTLLLTFLQLLFFKSYVMSGGFGEHCSLYRVILWHSFFSLLPTWATCGGDHHYRVIFRHEARWP